MKKKTLKGNIRRSTVLQTEIKKERKIKWTEEEKVNYTRENINEDNF